MRESQFKIGDRVVWVAPTDWDFKHGETFVVSGYYVSNAGNYCYTLSEHHAIAIEYRLEFEKVYNSPLYQALK